MHLLWIHANADGTAPTRHDQSVGRWLALVRARKVDLGDLLKEIDGWPGDEDPAWMIDARQATALVTLHRAEAEGLQLLPAEDVESIAVNLLGSRSAAIVRRACFEVLQASRSQRALEALLAAAGQRDVIDPIVQRAAVEGSATIVALILRLVASGELEPRVSVLVEVLTRLDDALAWSTLAGLLAPGPWRRSVAELVAKREVPRAWPLLRAHDGQDLDGWVRLRASIGADTTLGRATIERWFAERTRDGSLESLRRFIAKISLDDEALGFVEAIGERGPFGDRACELLSHHADREVRARLFDRLCSLLEAEVPPKKLPFDANVYLLALLRTCDEPGRVAALLTKLRGQPVGLLLVEAVGAVPRVEYIGALEQVLAESGRKRTWTSAARGALACCRALASGE
jgi:hypothetical protein